MSQGVSWKRVPTAAPPAKAASGAPQHTGTVRAAGIAAITPRPTALVPRPVGPLRVPASSLLPPVMHQAAQHESNSTSVVKLWAVSFMPSAMVRYGAHVSASSSTVIPTFTA